MLKFVEMDTTITLADQLKDEVGPVVLINTFTVPSEDALVHRARIGQSRQALRLPYSTLAR
jgi:hypothetical protein